MILAEKPPEDPAQAPRSTLATAVALAAVMLILCAIVGSAMWDTRRLAQRQAEEALSNITFSIERVLARDLLGLDILLRSYTGGPIPSLGGPDHASMPWSGLRPEFLGSFGITDATGRILPNPNGPVLAEMPWLQSLVESHRRDPSPGLRASEIGRSLVSGQMRIVVSRRRDDAQGRFNGIVFGSLRLSYFLQTFANFRFGKGGSMALLTLEGRLVASAPMDEASPGRDLGNSPVMQHLREHGPGVFTASSIIDGKERLYSTVQLDRLPFHLVVGRLTSEIYAGWNVRVVAVAALLMGVTLVLAMMATALHRELGRRLVAEQQAWRYAEQARATADELETVTGNADDLIMKLDWDGMRRFVSPASVRLLGYTPEELLGSDWLQFAHPDDLPALSSVLQELSSDGNGLAQVSYRVQHRNGDWRQVEARCRALPDGSGAIVAVRDMTERASLEAKLRQAQKMEAIGQLTAGVAHDFNNMLQGQIAGLELLLDEVDGQPGAMKLTERAILAGEKGARLTHSLLAFARQQVLRPQPVDVPPMLEELTALLSRTLGPKVTLEVSIDPRLPRPMADRAQLESALLNLCLNARDAMQDSGGRIRLSACAELELSGPPRARLCRSMIVVSVSDDGPGMSEELLARVCEPFFTTKKLGQGSGLGLSMVQGFARQSGGELHLHSTPGQGTCAQIRLPAAPAPVEALEEVRVEPVRTRPSGGRVLLVDDDADVLANLSEALETAGFTVLPAGSGAQAATILRSNVAVDVLVTDFGMPAMNGTELVQLARGLRANLPALIITGYVDGRLLEDVPPHVELLHKPFRVDSLVARINAVREPEMAL